MIEPATPADLDAIDEIERHSFPLPWPRETFEAELSRPHARLVVERAPRPLTSTGPPTITGFCNYWIVVPGPQGRINNDSGAEGELHILAIATHPDRRRAGTGARLLAHALDEATALGCTRATLEVRRGNAPAIALYQRASFRGVHIRARYYQDNHEDALVMLLDLTALTAPRR